MSDLSPANLTDDALIRRRLDDQLSAEDFAAFEERLRTDDAFRRRYVRLADLEASLYEECGEPMTPASQNALSSSTVANRLLIGSLAATVTCLLLALIVLLNRTESDLNGPLATAQGDPKTPQDAFITDAAANTPDAAVLVRVDGVQEEAFVPGRRLKPGVLKLNSGRVQLEFMSGAVVAVTGPAELRIESEKSATLLKGQVSAHVPPRARGFILNSPRTAIVDLGTEFGVRLDEAGDPEVEIRRGEIELSLLGDDGNSLINQRFRKDDVIRVDARNEALTKIPRIGAALPEIVPPTDTPLPVTDAYVAAIREEEPSIYWRFEADENGTVRNEVGTQWAAKIHQPDDTAESVRLANGHVRFKRTDSPRFLATTDALPNLNEGPYAIEFWMMPDDLEHATCLGVFPDSDAAARTHLNAVEIVTNTFLVHPPGAVRLLHRNPPARGGQSDRNVFSSGVCTPGQWQHVVIVKTDVALEIYFNGRLARRVETEDASGPGDYRLILGQLKMSSAMRQYAGAIDEFAVYKHALPPQRILKHYQAIVP